MPLMSKGLAFRVWFLSLLIVVSSGSSLLAQKSMAYHEGKLNALFNKLVACSCDSQRERVNDSICLNFQQVLKRADSFTYPFDSLRYVGKIMSPDKNFRLYGWNLVMDDGSYRYNCFIQKNRGNREPEVEHLEQLVDEPQDCMTITTSARRWIGALYYHIVPFEVAKSDYYLLLGWDGHNVYTNRKVIEILHFDKQGKALFGAPLINWRGKILSRVIFEYAKQARMTLNYDSSNNRVLFDHLSPMSDGYKGQFEYYGPDFSNDALLFHNGKWSLKEDVEIRNLRK